MALPLISFQSSEDEKQKEKKIYYNMMWYILQNRYKILWKHGGEKKKKTPPQKVMKSVWKSCHLPEAKFQISLKGWVGVSHAEKRERDDGGERKMYMV